MKKLFTSSNYIIYSVDGVEKEYAADSDYNLKNGVFTLLQRFGRGGTLIISDPTVVFDQAGTTAFTEATMTTFFRANSGKRSASVNGASLDNQIVVTQSNVAATLGGVIDSTKEYFLDGIIDPYPSVINLSGGKKLNLKGYDFGISGLVSAANNYTMVTGADVGSILCENLKMSASGTNSKLYGVTGDTGSEFIEHIRVSFDDCTSLGEASGFAQGRESGTRRLGGTPEFTLSGSWGGYFKDTSIAKDLTDGAYTLFKAGAGFTMSSRFVTNMKADLKTNISLLDFSISNFPNSNTLNINGAFITRNGLLDAGDATITPNVTRKELCSLWANNTGLRNTNVGGKVRITNEASTNLTVNNWSTINGTFTLGGAEHFDSPTNGELRHLGPNPVDFNFYIQFMFSGNNGNDLEIRIQRWDDSSSIWVSFNPFHPQRISIGGGGLNVCQFTDTSSVLLEKNDKVRIQVRNISAGNPVTLLEQSSIRTTSK